MVKNIWIPLALTLAILTGCTGKLTDVIREYTSGYISGQELKYMLDYKEAVIIIDLRMSNPYSMAHIPTSINIPMMNKDKIYRKIPRDCPIVLVSDIQNEEKSLQEELKSVGYTKVQCLSGGISSWHYSIEKGDD